MTAAPTHRGSRVIGVRRAHKHQPVLMLVAGLDVRIIDQAGTMLRHLTLDPTKDHQPIATTTTL